MVGNPVVGRNSEVGGKELFIKSEGKISGERGLLFVLLVLPMGLAFRVLSYNIMRSSPRTAPGTALLSSCPGFEIRA